MKRYHINSTLNAFFFYFTDIMVYIIIIHYYVFIYYHYYQPLRPLYIHILLSIIPPSFYATHTI